ncbi:hypothetical protein SDC9_164418 [bioreactor metagenome]|uniref:Uncharacterized protein n=1 Tax=bioreactor metagenome TaxID=1076179 RepID=A0A645FRI8_9ZZZZ
MGTAGRFAENEDGVKCLVMRLSFVEIPNSRIIKLFFDDEDTVTAKFAEKPNIEFVSRGLDAFLEDMPGKKIINALAHKVDGGYLLYRVSIAFMPEVRFIADPKIIKAATK